MFWVCYEGIVYLFDCVDIFMVLNLDKIGCVCCIDVNFGFLIGGMLKIG